MSTNSCEFSCLPALCHPSADVSGGPTIPYQVQELLLNDHACSF